MQVELVSPERILWTGEADMVVARTTDGDIAFLANHAPFIGALGIGVVTIEEPGGRQTKVAVHGGFVEVSNNKVTLLSDVAELSEDIDVTRAREAKERAEAALRHEHDVEIEAALRRAQVRLEVAA
jgi:F-type H+-transporting ATPase subunit epsilon